MIVIKTETGSIITDPKEISVGQDLEGDYYVIADLSDSDRVKPINLTALPHEKEALSQVVDDMYDYDYIEVALGQGQCRNVCLEMSQIIKLRCDTH